MFGAAFSVAIVIALTLMQRVTEDRGARPDHGRGADAVPGRARRGRARHRRPRDSIDAIDLGVITLDGNQVGLIVGGSLIVLGAFAATGAMRASAWNDRENRQAT